MSLKSILKILEQEFENYQALAIKENKHKVVRKIEEIHVEYNEEGLLKIRTYSLGYVRAPPPS